MTEQRTMPIWLVCASVLLAGGAVLAGAEKAPASRRLYSFESAREVQSIKTANARVTGVRQKATHGRYALEAAFEAAEQPSLEFSAGPGGWDWRAFGALGLDVTNPSDEPLAFSLEVTDRAGGKTVARTALPLRAGESASFALPLNSPPPLEMGMRGEPPIQGFRLMAEDHRPVDMARIAAFRIYLSKPTKPRMLLFDNIRLAPGVSYDKIVDAFGQYSREDWPGKLRSAAEFAARQAAEEAELKARPSLAERDEYGGWAAGPQLQATGYFRTLKRDGKWWLVAPSGHLFFSLGMDCVTTREGGTVIQGRESMFEWLPGAEDPLAAYYSTPRSWAPVGLKIKLNTGRQFNFYTANLQRKYGAGWQEAWRTTALARLRAWGFNTIANWSDPVFYSAKSMPYAVTLGVRGEVGEVSSGSDYWRRMYDVFDPKFAAAAEESVRTVARERREDPWCIGYFVDNELPWGSMRDDRTRYGLALGALSLGQASAAKRAFVEQLRARHGAIEKLNAAWSTRLGSWQELLENPHKPEGEFSAGLKEDLALYMKEFASRYFRTIRDALRKYDPNHLYLGVRFAWHTTEEVQACAEYCDVVSFNIYRPRVDPAQWGILREIDKPAIIGEFHMGALDRGMFHTGLVATADQAARAAMYQDYVRSVADHPSLVGCHFFKYNDEPLTGRPGDGENYNIGFTTVTDGLYPEMIAAAKAVHAEVYLRRAGKRSGGE